MRPPEPLRWTAAAAKRLEDAAARKTGAYLLEGVKAVEDALERPGVRVREVWLAEDLPRETADALGRGRDAPRGPARPRLCPRRRARQRHRRAPGRARLGRRRRVVRRRRSCRGRRARSSSSTASRTRATWGRCSASPRRSAPPAVLVAEGSADPLGPKALRASAGTAVVVPFARGPARPPRRRAARRRGCRSGSWTPAGATCSPSGPRPRASPWPSGARGAGPPTRSAAASDARLSIPLSPGRRVAERGRRRRRRALVPACVRLPARRRRRAGRLRRAARGRDDRRGRSDDEPDAGGAAPRASRPGRGDDARPTARRGSRASWCARTRAAAACCSTTAPRTAGAPSAAACTSRARTTTKTPVAVGDRVRVRRDGEEARARSRRCSPRTNVLARPDPHHPHRQLILAANVDQVVSRRRSPSRRSRRASSTACSPWPSGRASTRCSSSRRSTSSPPSRSSRSTAAWGTGSRDERVPRGRRRGRSGALLGRSRSSRGTAASARRRS